MNLAAILKAKGSNVVTIDGNARLIDAIDKLGEHRIGALVVVNAGRIAGIFSERDVIYCLRKYGAGVLEAPVSEAMTQEVITATPSTPILSALALMTQRRIRHLPVENGGELVGIASIGDLVKYRMEQIESEAQAMRSYIQAV
jgi:CBS domain-containing protein